MIDAATGKDIQAIKAHWAYIRSLALSADGKTLTSGGDDKTIRLWNAANGQQLVWLSDSKPIYSLAFAANDQKLVSSDENGAVKLWDVKTGSRLHLSIALILAEYCAVSSDGRMLADTSSASIKLWDTETGKTIREIKQTPKESNAPSFVRTVLSPDNKTLAISRADGTIKIIDAASGKELQAWQAYPDDVYISQVVFSPNGNLLLSYGLKAPVKMWQVK